MKLHLLPAFVRGHFFRVVVESPRGSNAKLKFDPELEAMSLSRPLTYGLTYPFDWGFVPGTRASDGDPLDAMLMWDSATYPGVVIPPGYYDFNEWFAFLFTDTSRTLSANFRVATGDFYSGDKNSASAGAVLKLGEKFSAQADWSFNDIELVEGSFTTHLLTTRFAYNFSTRMFLNGLVQYNSVAKEWNSNIRFNFIHHPLSDLFIVYNDLRDDLGVMKNRALIVKINRLVRF